MAFFKWFQLLVSRINLIIIVILVGLTITVWMIFKIARAMRRQKPNQASASNLQNNAKTDESPEIEGISIQFYGALSLLRKLSFKRLGSIYELPWYLIFGSASSGKTAALNNSGLKFPLRDASGSGSGIGATHSCNWWFAEQAILIDTAGHHTIQNDLSGVSKACWAHLLRLLKKHRRSQPLNGVLVTVSISDMLYCSPDQLREELRAIRQRLSELEIFLGAKIPVYILLTKADLLTGFVEFFGNFDSSDQNQVWGITFKLNENPPPANHLSDCFLAEFTLLQNRVDTMLLERLQQEQDRKMRGRIFRFPAELAALKGRIHDVITELGSGSKLLEAPFIRGVYMTSARQTITENTPSLHPQHSYFLSRLFQDVIFNETALVTRDKRLSRQRLFIRQGAFIASGLVLAIILACWISIYFQNKQFIADAAHRLNSYELLIRGIPTRDVDDADFLPILPALDSLQNADAGVWSGLHIASFAFSQKDSITDSLKVTYHNALNSFLLPRLLVQLQKKLDESKNINETFNALKFYGMLGRLGAIDPDFIAMQTEDMFASLYPGEGYENIRSSLTQHVKNLTASEIKPIDLDATRIANARDKIREESIAIRAFSLLLERREAHDLPVWRPAGIFGPTGQQVFERKSRRSLQDGIAGIYTQAGYSEVVVPYLHDAIQEALSENWARAGSPSDGSLSVNALSTAIMQQYFDAFRKNWESMLSDIKIRTPQNLADAAEMTRVLSGTPSQIEAISKSVSTMTNLHNSAFNQASSTDIVMTTDIPDPYAGLRTALSSPAQVSSGGTDGNKEPPSQLSALQSLIQALYDQLSRAAISSAEVARVFDVDGQLSHANQALTEEARRLPAPLDNWIAGMSADIDALFIRTARTNISDIWIARDARLCNRIIEGHYPFNRNASQDVEMSDFVRLFGPSGLFQSFFKERLEPFVDRKTTPWRWRGTFGVKGAESEAIVQFENADKIRRAFFPEGSEKPNININIRPVSLSDTANAVLLEIDGERVIYFHGPLQAKSIVWPSQQSTNLSRVAFQPGGRQQALTVNGDWSPFRLFDQAILTQEDTNDFRARFSDGKNLAEFDVQFGSVLSPFRLQALSEFSCPAHF